MKSAKGIAASPGIAIGPIFRLKKVDLTFHRLIVSNPSAELERFRQAAEKARAQLETLYQTVQKEFGEEEAGIFQAPDTHAGRSGPAAKYSDSHSG